MEISGTGYCGLLFRFLLLFLFISEMIIRESSAQCPGGGQYPYNSQYNNPYNPAGYQVYPQGQRDYGDECVQPRSSLVDTSAGCDIGRGLVCQANCRCGCLVPGSIYRNGKCRARVDRYCVDGPVTIECVRNAECTVPIRMCKCKRGYWSNDEGTACNSVSRLSKQNLWYMCAFQLVLLRFIPKILSK